MRDEEAGWPNQRIEQTRSRRAVDWLEEGWQMADFYVGQDYTRRQIGGRIGGGLQSALPTVNKVVVAACLHADAAHNPDAPEIILCGKTERVSAAGEWLSSQPDPIPVFVFYAPNRWECRGQFRVRSSHTSGAQFDRWVSRGSRPASAISRVIVLEHVPQA